MIIKLSERKTGSAGKLKAYILDEKHLGAKVGEAWTVNCTAGDDFDLAVQEMELTHSLNTRSRLNKTWHLIVSFDTDDIDPDTLRAIEQRVCEGLGMGAHQRIVAVHTDTDNLHFHIALNRIEPGTGRMINPSFSKYTMQDVGAEIEKEFGLTPLLSDPERVSPGTPGQAGWETITDTESFVTWARNNCIDMIDGANNWDELHRALAGVGVAIKQRGAGLVIVTQDGKYGIKASSLGRDFSKKKIEQRLGIFEESKYKTGKQQYHREPKTKSSRLWASYTALRESQKNKYKSGIAKLKEERASRYSSLRDRAGVKRERLKSSVLHRRVKKAQYSSMRYDRLVELSSIRDDYNTMVDVLKNETAYLSWDDFLMKAAVEGDIEARRLLMRRGRRRPSRSSRWIAGRAMGAGLAIPRYTGFTYNRFGEVEYTLAGGSKVIDAGTGVIVDWSHSDESVRAGLALAVDKFNGNLSVDNVALREKIIEIVKSENMTVEINGVKYKQGKELDGIEKISNRRDMERGGE